jgi:hypothetical protein
LWSVVSTWCPLRCRCGHHRRCARSYGPTTPRPVRTTADQESSPYGSRSAILAGVGAGARSALVYAISASTFWS